MASSFNLQEEGWLNLWCHHINLAVSFAAKKSLLLIKFSWSAWVSSLLSFGCTFDAVAVFILMVRWDLLPLFSIWCMGKIIALLFHCIRPYTCMFEVSFFQPLLSYNVSQQSLCAPISFCSPSLSFTHAVTIDQIVHSYLLQWIHGINLFHCLWS